MPFPRSLDHIRSACSRTKRVPSRRCGDDVLRDIEILQQTLNELRGCGLVSKGVYRFHSHEEADDWMIRQIAATHARRIEEEKKG